MQDQPPARPERERVGPRMQRPNLVVNGARGSRPVNEPFVLRQPRRVADQGLILLNLGYRASGKTIERLDQQAGPLLGKRSLDPIGSVLGSDRHRHRGQHWTSVERLDDTHDRDPGDRISVHDCPVNRRRAPVLRQERCMHVDETARRNCQQPLRKDLAVGGDDPDIRLICREGCFPGFAGQLLRLLDRNAVLERYRLHRPDHDALTAPARPVWLGDGDHDLVRRSENRPQCRDGKRRCSEKCDAHYHLPARASFLILRTIMSRLMPRSRSTNRQPSR